MKFTENNEKKVTWMKTEGLSSREKLLLGFFHRYLSKFNRDYLNDFYLSKMKDLKAEIQPVPSNAEVRAPA